MPVETVEKGAKDEASPASKNGANDGDSPSLDELKAENKRKAEELASLKAEHKIKLDRLQRLEALEEQRELTAKEEREKNSLEHTVESEAKKLRDSKETQPWIHISREEARNASTDAVLNNEIERSNDLIEDTAAEYKMDVEDFAKAIKKFSSPYANKRPERRTILAIREWKADKAAKDTLAERERKLKEKEDAEVAYRERGGRAPRNESLEKKFEDADAKEQMKLVIDMIPTGDSEK